MRGGGRACRISHIEHLHGVGDGGGTGTYITKMLWWGGIYHYEVKLGEGGGDADWRGT